MKTYSKIKKLKKEAAKHIIVFEKELDGYDSGLSLTDYISPTLAYHKNEFNKKLIFLDEEILFKKLIPIIL